MGKLKKLINEELKNWNAKELAWLMIATLTILGLSIYWQENIIGIFSAVTGVLCVILTGKGKLSSYIFGLFNTVLYAYIAFNAKFYGEVMLNLIYYLPMNFVGWYMWKKNMDSENGEVKKKRLSGKMQIILAIVTTLSIAAYGLVLKKLGGNLPYIDSMSTVISIVAQILCVKRYMEQWILWIVVNIVSVIMWISAFFTGGESIATLIMWSIYLLNAILMFVKWYKESEEELSNV